MATMAAPSKAMNHGMSASGPVRPVVRVASEIAAADPVLQTAFMPSSMKIDVDKPATGGHPAAHRAQNFHSCCPRLTRTAAPAPIHASVTTTQISSVVSGLDSLLLRASSSIAPSRAPSMVDDLHFMACGLLPDELAELQVRCATIKAASAAKDTSS